MVSLPSRRHAKHKAALCSFEEADRVFLISVREGDASLSYLPRYKHGESPALAIGGFSDVESS